MDISLTYILLMPDDVTSRAIKLAGGPTKVGAAFNITQAAVSQWEQIPADRVGKMSALTGIPPHELRPDLFPAPQAAQ